MHLWISFPFHVLRSVWEHRTAFWRVWAITTAASAIFIAWAVGRAAPPPKDDRQHGAILSERRRTGAGAAALATLAVFLGFYIVLTLTWEDFAGYDQSMFTLFTLKGHYFGPPIWRDNGRFFPLGHQEFNLIGHFTHTILGYHILPIVQLLLLAYIVLVLDAELSLTARAALTAAIFLTPAIAISYSGLIYPERNVLFWLACLLLFVQRFERTRSTVWAVAAGVSAQIMIYYKETSFVLLVGFAAGRLMLHCRNRDLGRWDYKRLWDKEGRFDLCLASLGALFLAYYFVVMLPRPNLRYADSARLPLAELFLAYIKLDLLAFLLPVFVLARTHMILRRRSAPSPLWDGLAIGGLAYLSAYFCLGIFSAYYLAPVDLIAVLYLGRYAVRSWGQFNMVRRIAVASALCLVLLQNVSLSAFRLFEDKNLVHAKAGIASSVKAGYTPPAAKPLRLFFPFATPYVLMEFASYLDFRGFAVEGAPDGNAAKYAVVLIGKDIALAGPCVPFRTIICHPGREPVAGDLVVVLPDDDASVAQVGEYLHQGEPVFSYKPRPRVPEWLDPFIRHLHIASIAFPQKQLPDHWLRASVTAWK